MLFHLWVISVSEHQKSMKAHVGQLQLGLIYHYRLSYVTWTQGIDIHFRVASS